MGSAAIGVRHVIAWIAVYIIVCGIIPVALDVIILRALDKGVSAWINLLTIIVLNTIFLRTLIMRYKLEVKIFSNISFRGILLACVCSVSFFILLDKIIDPFIDGIFVTSAEEYRRTIELMRQFPVVSFIRVCLLAPVAEEVLIRGCILNSLQNKYGLILSLVISSLLFAILHFNFVQIISAVICGLILGLLYINTGSLLVCILAHSLYNAISYFTSVLL